MVKAMVRGDSVGTVRGYVLGNGRWWSVGGCLCGWWAVFVVVIMINGVVAAAGSMCDGVDCRR